MPDTDTSTAAARLASVAAAAAAVRKALGSVIVGQDQAVEEVLACLVCGGHVLLEGVPGLAKTTMVSALASAAGLEHGRIQFTPDLMPGDILGSEVLEEDRASGARSFRYQKGPVFTQVLLADEINRTPPKTQAALLQAMQERKVSFGGRTHELPAPFLVFATQNPIENEGTYPLPEAQLDRFMFKVVMTYPARDEERRIALLDPGAVAQLPVGAAGAAWPWAAARSLLRDMPVADSVLDAAVRLARGTRPNEPEADAFVRQNVRWGAGPRASQYLLLAAKSLAAARGQAAPTLEHLRRAAYPVLRHRIIPSFSAEAGRVTPDDVVRRLLETLA